MNLPFIIKNLFLGILYTSACLGAGVITFKVIRKDYISFIQPVTLSAFASIFLLGSGILTILWLIILSFNFFYIFIVLCVVLSTAIMGGYFIWQNTSEIRILLTEFWSYFASESIIWKGIICFTLAIIFLTALDSLSPLQHNGDAAAFYMVLPKLWTATNRLSSLGGYEAFMTIGLHGELHFAALMMLGSEWGAKFITWPIGIACAIILAAIARIAGAGHRGQFLTVSLAFTSTAFIFLIGDGKTDLFGAAMGCAAFYWIMNDKFGYEVLRYYIAGLFAGFAIIGKISYLPIIIPCIMLFTTWIHFSGNYIQQRHLREKIKYLWRKVAWISVGLSIPVFLHLYKNWILFGEPFAPFFYFGDDPFPDSWQNQSWFLPETVRRIILTYPLALIYGKYPMQYGNFSVLLLAFAPLLVMIPKSKSFLNSLKVQLSIVGITGVIIWIIIRPGVFAPRYILYTLLLLIPVIAWVTDYVLNIESKPRIISATVTILCFFYIFGINGILAKKFIRSLNENSTKQSLINASNKLNQVAGSNDRVLSLNYFTYWLKPDILIKLATSEEKRYFWESEKKSPVEIWSRIYELGFNYVLVDNNTYALIAKKLVTPYVSPDFVVNKIFDEQDFSLYEVKSKKHKYN